MIKVDTACMQAQADQMNEIARHLNSISDSIMDVSRNLRWKSGVDETVRMRLSEYGQTVLNLQEKSGQLSAVLNNTSGQYTQTENEAKKLEASANDLGKMFDDLVNVAQSIIDENWWVLPGIAIGGGIVAPWLMQLLTDNKSHTGTPAYGNWNTVGDWLGAAVDDDKRGVTAWLGKGSASYKSDFIEAEFNGSIGKARADYDADFSIFGSKSKGEMNKGEWKESERTTLLNAELGGEASVTLLEGKAKVKQGDDILGSETSAELVVGKASVSGKGQLSVGEKGLNAYVKGEAIVTAVEGKVQKKYNILGFEVGLTAKGYAGAAGLEGKAGIEDGKFVLSGGAALGYGGSLGIEIGFNDTGWNAVVDTVEYGWDTLKNAGNAALDFFLN